MSGQPFEPREGGVKVVFDVPEAVVAAAVQTISAADFSVDRYYRTEFTEAEQQLIVAAFDAAYQESPFTCYRMGVGEALHQMT